MIELTPDQCRRCWGCGQIAGGSDNAAPWTVWEELPPGSDMAVRLGLVYPIACPVCDGSGLRADVSASETARPPTFEEFSRANRSRCTRWHPGFPDDEAWTIADWSNAMCGEAGEVANVVKKLRRHETGLVGAIDPEIDALRAALADEIGDVFAYLDLLAQHQGLDVWRCAAEKFNRVSERQGFPERIEIPG